MSLSLRFAFLGAALLLVACGGSEHASIPAVEPVYIPMPSEEDSLYDEDEAADLVELAADGRIVEPRSGLGRYLVRHWELVSLVNGESLVYWLRKLVFRGAWLDHRVKEGLLDVAFEDDTGDFGYAEPKGGRTLLELAPVPSWHEYQYRA